MRQARMIGVAAILATLASFAPDLAAARPVVRTQRFAVDAQYGTTHVYIAAGGTDRFAASFVATFGGTSSQPSVVTVTPSSTAWQAVTTPVGLVSTLTLPDVPWYAGVTALQAMLIGEAMHSSNFSFRVVYRSIYGAFVDSIDGVTDGDIKDCFWFLTIDGADSKVGVSEAIISEDNTKTTALIEWYFKVASASSSKQAELKSRPL